MPSQEPTLPTLRAAARATLRAAVHALHAGAWVIGRPSVLGAAYVLALTAAAESRPLVSETERVLGDDSSEVRAWVTVRFADTIRSMEWTLALTAIVLGAALGAMAGALLRLHRRALDQPPLRPVLFLPASLALTAALHACFWARSVAISPAFYAADWYAEGGVRRAIQLAITDDLGPRGATCLFALVLAFVVPPWRWPALAGRVTRAARARSSTRTLAVAAAMACVAAGACLAAFGRPSPAPEGARARPNVLILGADSFRHEALNPRVMPRLSALAEKGTRFSRAYVSIARTFPSWVTLLTGRYAFRHGIRSMLPRHEDRQKDFDAVPARLARRGYTTAVVSDYGGDIFSAMDFGFQRADVPHNNFREVIRTTGMSRAGPLLPFLHARLGRRVFPTLREVPAGADAGMLADDAIAALRQMRGAPFFLTVFFSAPHFPYAAPAPYYERFTDRGYLGPYKYHKASWMAPNEAPDARDLAQLRGLYEGALASVDDAAARILEEIRRRGEEENTIVVVLGDHGEDLLDAGRWHGHGNHLFGDHQLHIPLVVVDPRSPRGRVERSVVRDVDLAPTLYELTGTEPPLDLDGASLAPALAGAPVSPRLAFAETELWIGVVKDLKDELRFPYPSVVHYAEVDGAHDDEIVLKRSMRAVTTLARHRMVLEDPWKLIYIPTRDGVRWELFDTATDPEDLTDVAAQNPAQVERLKGLLWQWMLRDPDMEQRRGYLAPRGVSIPEIDGPKAP